jgi:NADPH2:quinone reductase
MSAVVVATGFGGPDVVSVIDEPIPEPGPGQVRIAVRAAGVNPIDYKSYSGAMGADPSSLPKRLGAEASGVVDALGPAVDSVRVGDEVIAYRAPGAYAEHLIVDADALTAKPAVMPWNEAAGLLLTGVTAVHALLAADVGPGDTVLVHGASGGVGLMAVQLAVARNATVIATASPAKHDLLTGLGAVAVTYGDGLADRVRAAAPEGIDAALDLIGTDEAVEVSLELVASRDRIVTVAAFGRAKQDGIKLLGGAPGADPGTEIRKAARAQLADAVRDGTLHVLVGRTYPLAQAADAHRDLMSGHATGKLVLTVTG